MEQFGSHGTDFHEIRYFNIFRNFVKKIQVSTKSDKNKGYFTRRPIYIFITSRQILLRMKNVSDNSCRESRNTHFMSILFNRVVYEVMWENVVEPGRPQMTTWRMHIARCIPKAINTSREVKKFPEFPCRRRMRHKIVRSDVVGRLACLFAVVTGVDRFQCAVSLVSVLVTREC